MKDAIAAQPDRRFRIRPEAVLAVLLLAAVSGAVYLWARQSDPAREHVEAGQNYLRMNNGGAAEREWKEAVRRNPESAAAWELLAEYYTRDENYGAAVEPLRQLARLRPETPHIYDRLATCAEKADDRAAVLKGAETALQRDPNDVGALAIEAKLLAKSDDEQKRLTILRRLVKLRPNDPGFLVLAARTMTNAHFYDEAAPLIERMLTLDPNSVEAYGLRGRRWLDTAASPQDLARAEADYLKALQLNPRGPMIRLQLGKVYLRLGQTERAAFHLEQTAAMLPNQPEVFYDLAAAYTQASRPADAAAARRRFADLREREDRMTVLEKRCTASPSDFEDHLQMGVLCLDRGDYDRADYYLNRARTLRPQDPKANAALKQLAAVTAETQPAVTEGRP